MPTNTQTTASPEIVLPAGTAVVPTLAVPTLIAQALHPGADPDDTAFQAALRSHVRMLNKAARAGTVRVVSFYGEEITFDDADAAGTAGAFLTVAELTRYLSTLPLPIALRSGGPGEPLPLARAIPVAQQNDEVVLGAIRAADYDPLALPPRVHGKPWVKTLARKRCVPPMTPAAFDHSWKALRAAGRIKERD